MISEVNIKYSNLGALFDAWKVIFSLNEKKSD